MYVVVVRSEEANGATAIYRGASLPDIIRRLQQRYCKRRGSSWHGPSSDAFIRAHYKVDLSAAEIARRLAEKRGQRITKNMVIARARTLAGKPRRKGC